MTYWTEKLWKIEDGFGQSEGTNETGEIWPDGLLIGDIYLQSSPSRLSLDGIGQSYGGDKYSSSEYSAGKYRQPLTTEVVYPVVMSSYKQNKSGQSLPKSGRGNFSKSADRYADLRKLICACAQITNCRPKSQSPRSVRARIQRDGHCKCFGKESGYVSKEKSFDRPCRKHGTNEYFDQGQQEMKSGKYGGHGSGGYEKQHQPFGGAYIVDGGSTSGGGIYIAEVGGKASVYSQAMETHYTPVVESYEQSQGAAYVAESGDKSGGGIYIAEVGGKETHYTPVVESYEQSGKCLYVTGKGEAGKFGDLQQHSEHGKSHATGGYTYVALVGESSNSQGAAYVAESGDKSGGGIYIAEVGGKETHYTPVVESYEQSGKCLYVTGKGEAGKFGDLQQHSEHGKSHATGGYTYVALVGESSNKSPHSFDAGDGKDALEKCTCKSASQGAAYVAESGDKQVKYESGAKNYEMGKHGGYEKHSEQGGRHASGGGIYIAEVGGKETHYTPVVESYEQSGKCLYVTGKGEAGKFGDLQQHSEHGKSHATGGYTYVALVGESSNSQGAAYVAESGDKSGGGIYIAEVGGKETHYTPVVESYEQSQGAAYVAESGDKSGGGIYIAEVGGKETHYTPVVESYEQGKFGDLQQHSEHGKSHATGGYTYVALVGESSNKSPHSFDAGDGKDALEKCTCKSASQGAAYVAESGDKQVKYESGAKNYEMGKHGGYEKHSEQGGRHASGGGIYIAEVGGKETHYTPVVESYEQSGKCLYVTGKGETGKFGDLQQHSEHGKSHATGGYTYVALVGESSNKSPHSFDAGDGKDALEKCTCKSAPKEVTDSAELGDKQAKFEPYCENCEMGKHIGLEKYTEHSGSHATGGYTYVAHVGGSRKSQNNQPQALIIIRRLLKQFLKRHLS
ncbi:hypothetical protein Aperf_G00000118094 [Anoplocephala perfoliata]